MDKAELDDELQKIFIYPTHTQQPETSSPFLSARKPEDRRKTNEDIKKAKLGVRVVFIFNERQTETLSDQSLLAKWLGRVPNRE